MKVLHVLNELRSSGAEMMLNQAYPYWSRAGVDSHILCIGKTKGPFAPEMEKTGFSVFHLPIQALSHHAFCRKFRDLLKKNHYDIVHFHAEGHFVFLALIGWSAGARMSRTFHSNFPFEGWRKTRRSLQYNLLRKLGCRFVAIGESVKQTEKRYGTECLLLENWCDTGRFKPAGDEEKKKIRQTLNLPVDSTVLCSVGNCFPVKNHPLILKALKQYKECNDNFIYLHIGEEDVDRSDYHLAEQLGLLEQVRFLGRIDPLQYLQSSNVFIMPSQYEGFGIAGLEALMCGLRTVFSHVAGLKDFAAYDLPQLTYCSLAPDSLCRAIETTLQKPVDLDKIEKMRQHYSVQSGAERYLNLWKEMTNG